MFRSMLPRKCNCRSCTVCMSSFLETDVRTVVLRTLSSRLTPVMTRHALVAKELN